MVEYLVRWKEYGVEFDSWLIINKLSNARDLVKDYYNTLYKQIIFDLALRLLSSATLTIFAPTYLGPCTTAPVVAQLEQPAAATPATSFSRRPRGRPRKR